MNHNQPFFWILLLVSSLLLTLLMVPWVIRLAHRWGAVDQPDARKVHRRAMPRMGGLAFALPLFVLPLSLLASFAPAARADLVGFLLGLLVVVASGMADDIKGISPKLKFVGVGVGSLLFVLLTDTAIGKLGDLFGLGMVETGWLAIPITVVAMVGFVNALNLSDGLDGLAAGIALIAAFFLVFWGLKAGDVLTPVLSVVLLGGTLGFLYFNSHPAKVFMGDTGSLLLGYVLGAIALLLLRQPPSFAGNTLTPVTMGILLALPLGDTVYVMAKRFKEGKSPFLPDKTHFHHRLLALGLPHNGVVGVFYALMMLYGIAAILLLGRAAWVQLVGLAALLGGTYLSLYLFERSGVRFHVDEEAQAAHDRVSRTAGNWPTRVSGVSVPYVTWMIPLLLAYPVATLEGFGHMKLLVGIGVLLVLALFPWKNRHSSAWTSGLYYWLVLIPVLSINGYGSEFSKSFLFGASVFLAVWVGVKLYLHRHGEIFLTAGLEMLLVSLSWVAPWLASGFGLIAEAQLPELYMACLQAVVFLLATKIVLRRQARRNRQLLFSLLLLNGLLLV